MNKNILIFLAIIFLSGCSLTNKKEGLFRDRGLDYEREQAVGKKLEAPSGVEIKGKSDFYNIPETKSDGPDIMEPDMPVDIIEVPVEQTVEEVESQE